MADELTKADLQLAVKEAIDSENKKWQEKISKVEETYKSKINELETVPKIREEFKKQGGNDKAFDTFFKVNKDQISSDKFANDIKNLKKEQDYFFNSSNVAKENEVNVSDEMEKTVKDKGSKVTSKQFYGNTLYKK